MRREPGIALAIALIAGTILSIAAQSQPVTTGPAVTTDELPSAPAALVPSDSDFRIVVGDQSAGP